MDNEGFDMVRSGIVTYGLYPSDEVDHSIAALKPAMELLAKGSSCEGCESRNRYRLWMDICRTA